MATRDYRDLTQVFNGKYKGVQKPLATSKPPYYKMSEFATIEDALSFVQVLPKDNGVYITQHGLIINREGENTDRTGEYGYRVISEFATPDYTKSEEDRILRKSARIFSALSPSTYQVRWRR